MTTNECLEKERRLENDSYVQNMIAQANARYILFNTSEERANFPNYTIKDENLNILAFYYLNLGCNLLENKEIEASRAPIEKAASILEFVHGSKTNQQNTSNFYGLVSSLAYYACFQYSKAFILIRKIQSEQKIARLISLFLKRNFVILSNEINEVITDNNYSDELVKELDETEADRRINEFIIAKGLDGFIKYLQTGDKEILETARKSLTSLKEISELKSDPGTWWTIRLLLLIIDGMLESSLWSSLGIHFDVDSRFIQSYIKSLVYSRPRGIYELFITQRKSLKNVLNVDNLGCIVNIPTSSGKTRIAEIAILDMLVKNPSSKILYIAPFRSLAFEVENSLETSFNHVGIVVSHLYGGSLYSKLDEKLINESNVIIATPEKAKALLRGNEDILNSIELIIIDEGHLIGADKRLIVNEIFYEELRYFVSKNKGRFLVLSAVLPNSDDLGDWLTNSKESVYRDVWRPSDERLGILEWDGEFVNLNWESNDKERSSFNRKFIIQEQLPLTRKQKTPKYFPSDKNEAVATTAYKLRNFGSVLIFVGKKASVFVMAAAYKRSLGNSPEDFKWKNEDDWKTFELACVETYGEDSNWLLYAKKGILCHNSDLHSDVRLPMERLMRKDKPLVIIATSTLGQGVNIGVSTVIFSTIFQSKGQIKAREFWNIAGRAGRAFVDHEGKILVALDSSDTSTYKARNKIKWYKQEIAGYFDKGKLESAKSGLLTLVKFLKQISGEKGIDFETLLQLISENKILEVVSEVKEIDDILDWIDDALLSLHLTNNLEEGEPNIEWVEKFFSGSLACIQASKDKVITSDNFVSFIKARVAGISKKIGNDRAKWNSIVRSGLPLNSNLIIEDKLFDVLLDVSAYKASKMEIDDKISLLKKIEDTLIDLPIISEENLSTSANYDKIRESWLRGIEMSQIIELEGATEIITKLYAFKMPWIISGIAKKLKLREFTDESEILDELAILVESGLPDLKSVKIHQAGIRSRAAAREIGEQFIFELWNMTVKDYKLELLLNKEDYIKSVSSASGKWLELMVSNSKISRHIVDKVPSFSYGKTHELTTILYPKKIKEKQYLMSSDLSFIKEIEKSTIDFSSVNNIPGIFFKYNSDQNSWNMEVDNPYVHVRS